MQRWLEQRRRRPFLSEPARGLLVSRADWILVAAGVVVLLWLIGDINVNATVTELAPTVTQGGHLIPQKDEPPSPKDSKGGPSDGPGITYGVYTTPTFVD